MLHVILLILKIIGIVIAALLGILILLLFTVLLIPIRYRVFGKKADNNLIAKAKVSWLLKLIFLRVNMADSDISIRLRIAGLVVYDNKRPKREKKQKVKKKRKAKKKPKVKVKKSRDIKIEEKFVETKESISNINSNENIKVMEHIRETKDEVVEEKVVEEKAVEDKVVEEKKKNPFKELYRKIKGFFLKVKGIIENIRNLLSKVRSIGAKKNLIKMFLQEENNRAGVKSVFISLKGILKHIAPKKVKGSIFFGTGDPCNTGQILGIASVFYGIYGDKIQITPNFEEEVIEGELFVKGRIRLFTLLIIVIKLIRNRNFRQLLKNAKQLKEEF